MSESASFWDKTAQRYAKRPISDEETYQRKLAETQSFLEPHMHIVEFGCGTGTTAIHHAPYVRHIDAVDISENMLEIGRRKAREADVRNIAFTRGTLAEFNADDDSVDVVLGLNVMHLVPDRHAVLAEVARILRPGGVFISSTVCLGRSYLRFIARVAPLGRMLGLMPEIFVLTEAGLAREMQEAGFTIERRWHHGKGDISVFMVARKAE